MRISDWSSDVCSSDLGAALLRRLGRIGLGRAGTGGEQRHVPSGEVEMLDVPDRQFLAALAEIDAVAGGPGGRPRGHLVRRQLALRQDVQPFAPDIAGRSAPNYAVTQVSRTEEQQDAL